ncbi:MAG TPA: 16S rRNA (guanine(527)-N(7))-methyltransferase RsmG [Chloroflexia bacterium]|nr:16S rRNA (guanine(527)-N(7))-methyltransferase RsmG [Chloroflexia bacterium]
METRLAILEEGARKLGFTLTPRQLDQFQLYYDTLVDWNSRINLTAITDYDLVQVRHFLDSLTVAAALLSELRGTQPGLAAPPAAFRLIDIGTGAGFPGVPLKLLWPHIDLTLNDSVGKKTTFLQELARALTLEDVRVVTARAEELGQDKLHRQRYDLVTARAVSALPVLCEYCLPLARVGGRLLAPKKGDISQELSEGKRAARLLGGQLAKTYPFTLPGDEEPRTVICIRKVASTPSGYPRRVGLAKSKPLGR